MTKSISDIAFEALTSEDDGRVCRDIPDEACNDQPKNFITHIMSLFLTKCADGLIDPKLVLSWILSATGTPSYFVGLLVPIREAGALLPQLFTSAYLRSLPKRKFAWAFGSFLQGLSASGMGLAVIHLEDVALGTAIILLLAMLALARSICSVSYKDVLGKTIDKSKRGTATGTASSLAAGFVILFAFLLSLQIFNKITLLTIGLFLAGLFWFLASFLFLTLTEEKGATEGGGSPLNVALKNIKLLTKDKQLILFILTRALLVATALSPPFMVAIAAKNYKDGFGDIGLLLLATSLASLLSGYIWGRLSDKSSRLVLMYSALIGGITLAATTFLSMFELLSDNYLLPLLLFSLMISYQGVRLGRSTHLVDMADEETRAAYTALSNSVIGLFLLLVGGSFSILASIFNENFILAISSLMCFLSMISTYYLREEQIA
ncbi:MAG: MFS transporter permease [Rhizobiales bacterium]|nr:MFS transporter permease [Hyphomicrobiales bacterium]